MWADHYITRLQISTGGSSTKTAQVHPVFSRQSCIDVKTGCAEPLIINVVLGQLWLTYSCGRVFS